MLFLEGNSAPATSSPVECTAVTRGAIITNFSADALALAEGKPAHAIINASEVMIGKGMEGAQLSARNILTGHAEQLGQRHS